MRRPQGEQIGEPQLPLWKRDWDGEMGLKDSKRFLRPSGKQRMDWTARKTGVCRNTPVRLETGVGFGRPQSRFVHSRRSARSHAEPSRSTRK